MTSLSISGSKWSFSFPNQTKTGSQKHPDRFSYSKTISVDVSQFRQVSQPARFLFICQNPPSKPVPLETNYKHLMFTSSTATQTNHRKIATLITVQKAVIHFILIIYWLKIFFVLFYIFKSAFLYLTVFCIEEELSDFCGSLILG